jgi:hypothetical protein
MEKHETLNQGIVQERVFGDDRQRNQRAVNERTPTKTQEAQVFNVHRQRGNPQPSRTPKRGIVHRVSLKLTPHYLC